MARVKPNVSGIASFDAPCVGRINFGPQSFEPLPADATTALMDAIADEERKAMQRKLDEAERKLKTASVCEIGAGNTNVASYCEHWETRATEAEAKLEEVEHTAGMNQAKADVVIITGLQQQLADLKAEHEAVKKVAAEWRDTASGYKDALDYSVKLHNTKVDENAALRAEHSTSFRDHELRIAQLRSELQATQSALDIVSSDPPQPSLTQRVKRFFTGNR